MIPASLQTAIALGPSEPIEPPWPFSEDGISK